MDKMRLKIAATATCAAFLVVGIGLESPRQASAGGGAGPAVTCTSSSPCLIELNTSTGLAISGVSKKGSGIEGQTKFNSTSQSNGQIGVFGQDLSTSGMFNIGVFGLSPRGVAVAGNSTSGQGVNGYSHDSTGVFGVSTTLDGVEGIGARFGVWGLSANGDGVRAESNSSSAESLFIWQDGAGHLIRAAQATCGCYEMSLDINGNMITRGSITQNGNPTLITQTSSGSKVVAYGPRQSQPTIEDTGEAQMVSGISFVRIDPGFAAAIDKNATYTVLITPEGDTNGVYVTSKSLQGFVVRENRNGRSTVGFGYRIVAKPFDTNASRLPLMSTIPRFKAFDVPAYGNIVHAHGARTNGIR
jgi:hypothetical protein